MITGSVYVILFMLQMLRLYMHTIGCFRSCTI